MQDLTNVLFLLAFIIFIGTVGVFMLITLFVVLDKIFFNGGKENGKQQDSN